MEAEVVNVERIDDARLLQSVEALYRDALARDVMEARGVGPRESQAEQQRITYPCTSNDTRHRASH